MYSVQMQLGAAVVHLGTWGFMTVCLELTYVYRLLTVCDSMHALGSRSTSLP